MHEIWNEICYELKSCINKDVLEKEYENAIANCMTHLGWKKFKGEIITQYPIQLGHEKKYADIVIMQDNVEQFVIEVKRPSHIIQPDDKKQLFSYMRLTKHQMKFGLYIGDKIRLFYGDHKSPIEEVFSFEISENNSDGTMFVELFSKELFSTQVLSSFCEAQRERINRLNFTTERLDEFFCDAKYEENIKLLIKEKFVNEGLDEGLVIESLNKIRLSVLHSEQTLANNNIVHQTISDSTYGQKKTSRKKLPRYSLCNGNPLKQRRFVLALVRQYIKDHPAKTYSELLDIFSREIGAYGILLSYDEARTKYIKDDKPFFYKEKEGLISGDGRQIVVSSQWNEEDTDKVMKLAQRLNYKVEKI